MSMKLVKYLSNLGYGTRREVAELIRQRSVTRRDGSMVSPDDDFLHDDLLVGGSGLDVQPGSVIMLNKPVGYVCSTSDTNPLVYDLLPARFRLRSPVIAPIGRLDQDTSGLLLLTDDGTLNHRLTSPRSHVSKTYIVELVNELRGDESHVFASGTFMLKDETKPLLPAELSVVNARSARIVVREGRYHQVRRMFAAVGNHVVALRRVAVGSLDLGSLAEGEWRILNGDEMERTASR